MIVRVGERALFYLARSKTVGEWSPADQHVVLQPSIWSFNRHPTWPTQPFDLTATLTNDGASLHAHSDPYGRVFGLVGLTSSRRRPSSRRAETIGQATSGRPWRRGSVCHVISSAFYIYHEARNLKRRANNLRSY